MLQILVNALPLVGVLLMLFLVDWRIGLTLTLYSAVVLSALNRVRGISIPDWVAGRQASADLAGFIEERLAGTEDIRSSRATDYAMRQLYGLMRELMRCYRRAPQEHRWCRADAPLVCRPGGSSGPSSATAAASSSPRATLARGVRRPLLTGLIQKAVFDTLTRHARAGLGLWALLALLVAIQGVGAVTACAGDWCNITIEFGVGALLRKNMLAHVLCQPGARALPGSPGEAVSRFRTDASEIMSSIWHPLVLLGQVLLGVVAFGILLRIDALVTVVVLLPLLAVVVVTQVVTNRMQGYRRASRAARRIPSPSATSPSLSAIRSG